MITPSMTTFYRVTTSTRSKDGREHIQLTGLYKEALDRAGRVIVQRSITFHVEYRPVDQLYHWTKRVQTGPKTWKTLDQTFSPGQLPSRQLIQKAA